MRRPGEQRRTGTMGDKIGQRGQRQGHKESVLE